MGNIEKDASRPSKRVPCEVYSRIVGYLRPVQDWNKGKQQEFSERRMYVVESSDLVARASSSDGSGSGTGQQVQQGQPCPETGT